MSIYADKKPKVSSKNNEKKTSSSICYDLPDINYRRSFESQNAENSNDNSYSKPSDDRMKYLMKKYREFIHYNSPEPRKYGARAFTKNSEIYIAPGEESALPHELGHVYQQETQNIPATGEMKGEKVNTDPKLEKEADQTARNIEDYIPKIIFKDTNDNKTKDVIQFNLPDDKKLQRIVIEEAEKLGIFYYNIDVIIDKTRKDYNSKLKYLLYSFFTDGFQDYLHVCIDWALKSMQNKLDKNSIEYQLYLDLEKGKKIGEELSESDKAENERIAKIISMLNTKKTFPINTKSACTLNTVMKWMEQEHRESLKKYILELKDYCDAEGITSVLESADVNVLKVEDRIMLKNSEKSLQKQFINRLKMMTEYIQEVAKKTDADGKTFGEKYWIRSTGSDPHYKGQHALFLVNKQNQEGYKNNDSKKKGEIAKVYKPHDLSADNAVVGKRGMFAMLNKSLGEVFRSELNNLGMNVSENENAFATMCIDVEHHTEEFVTKKSKMTKEEAQKYFFRAGMLKVITDAMAITDLHRDNIMPFENCPLIIDAEVDFFKYAESGLEVDALVEDEYQNRSTNSSFTVEGENKKSGELFKDEESEDKESEYRKRYKEGYNFMLKQMRSKKKKFARLYFQQLENVNKTRILPIKTGTFAELLHFYMLTSTEKGKSEIISSISEQIKKNLLPNNSNGSGDNTIEFIFNQKNLTVKFSNSNNLNMAIKNALDNGTIIAMYADMDGNIYLDDTIIGNIINEKTKSVANRGKIMNVMREKFLEELKNKTFM